LGPESFPADKDDDRDHPEGGRDECDPYPLHLSGRGFAIAAAKCPPLDFLPLTAFSIENEEQQDKVENNEADREGVHGGVNAGRTRHVPLPHRSHRSAVPLSRLRPRCEDDLEGPLCQVRSRAISKSAWEDDREAEVVGYADRRPIVRDHGSVWMLDR
jgi:hypothetical protein